MMRYVNKQAFDVLLRVWPLEVVKVDEVARAPMVGVELLHAEWWKAFDHRRDKSEDLSAVIIRTGSLKVFQQIAAAEARKRTLH